MPSSEQLSIALADRYEILRELGRGGMATVYLARDVRHARQVAIKVLHPELAAVLGAERFLAEITTTANLQHPHILPLFDSGSADGQLFYVMPFIDGETLRAKLDRETQLPIDEAVGIAREVADALQYAHDRGVIHRDIKPENILLQGGHALVADFGIALAVQHAGGQRMTQTGLSLGTPQYMAPEQAMGEKAVDARADIYALGAVTYEMLAGEPPFTGPTAQAIIARVLTSQPAPLGAVRSRVPEHVEMAVQRALEKLPADRFTSALEFDAHLRQPLATAATRAHTPARANTPTVSRTLFAATSLSLATLAAIGFVRGPREPTANSRPMRFSVELPDSARLAPQNSFALAIAPDGSEIVYRGISANGAVLFRRALDSLSVEEISESFNPMNVHYDAGGSTLYMQDQTRQLFRFSRAGGKPTLIADSVERPMRHGTGFIISWDGRLWYMDANGQNRTLVTSAARGASSVPLESDPAALPDDRALLFNLRAGSAEQVPEIAVANLADGSITRLGVLGAYPRYVRSGHLLFVRADGLYAVPFDVKRRKVTAEPMLVEREVFGLGNRASYDVSETGVLAFIRRQDAPLQRLIITDAEGRERPLDLPEGRFAGLRFSPDGTRIAFHRGAEPGNDIWIFNRRTSYLQRLTNGGVNTQPVWTIDGSRLAWIRRTHDTTRIVWQASDGSGAVSTAAALPSMPFWFRFTPDGRAATIVVGPGHRHDIGVYGLDSSVSPRMLVSGRGDDLSPSVSSDGRWMVWSNDLSRRHELFLTEIAHPETQIPLTTTGGSSPQWSADGRSVFFLGPQHVMRLHLEFSPRVELTKIDTLFVNPTWNQNNLAYNFDYSRSTDEFVFAVPTQRTESRLVVVIGWLDDLKRRFATERQP